MTFWVNLIKNFNIATHFVCHKRQLFRGSSTTKTHFARSLIFQRIAEKWHCIIAYIATVDWFAIYEFIFGFMLTFLVHFVIPFMFPRIIWLTFHIESMSGFGVCYK